MTAISDIVPRRTALHSVEFHVIIRACLNHAKGGHSDFYERKTTYCEGGSSTTSDVRGGCKAALAHKGDARISRIEYMADKTGVRGRVPREASEHKSEHTNRIIEANLFGLPIVRRLPSSFHTVKSRRLVRTTVLSFYTCWATSCKCPQVPHISMTGGSSQLFLRKRDAA